MQSFLNLNADGVSLTAVGQSGHLCQTWQTSREARYAAMATLLGGETPEAMCDRRFDAFAAATGLTVVQSGPLVSVDRLLVDYFVANPPFATNAVKKSEFPDAIVLHALEKWATDRATKILIVAKDGDWKSYFEAPMAPSQ